MIVRVTALGGSPIQGDVPNPKAQVDLNQAATMLNDAINKGSFQIPVDVTNIQNVCNIMYTAFLSALCDLQILVRHDVYWCYVLLQPIFLTAVPYTLSSSQYQSVPEYYVAPPPAKTTYSAGEWYYRACRNIWLCFSEFFLYCLKLYCTFCICIV